MQATTFRCDYPKATIIYLHGFKINPPAYLKLAEQFQNMNYNFDVLWFPGYNNSEALSNKETTLLQYASLVNDYINHQKLANVIIFGHSMGGAIAALVNTFNNKYITKTILIDPFNIVFYKKMIVNLTNDQGELNIKLLNDKYYHQAIAGFNLSDEEKKTHYLPLLNDMLNGETLNHVGAAIAKLQNTTVVFGSNDKVVWPQDSIVYFKWLNPTLKFIEIDNGGHIPHLCQTDDFIKKIISTIK